MAIWKPRNKRRSRALQEARFAALHPFLDVARFLGATGAQVTRRQRISGALTPGLTSLRLATAGEDARRCRLNVEVIERERGAASGSLDRLVRRTSNAHATAVPRYWHFERRVLATDRSF